MINLLSFFLLQKVGIAHGYKNLTIYPKSYSKRSLYNLLYLHYESKNSVIYFIFDSLDLVYSQRHKKASLENFDCLWNLFYGIYLVETCPLIKRPNDYSFPSGHTACIFVCAFMIHDKLPKKYTLPILIFAILVAFSRLYVGVHYPTDVLAGIVLAYIIYRWVKKIMPE